MEAAGLAIGVAGLVGLFSACLDVIEKVDSYRDFGVESHALLARFQADKIRFRQWGQDTGIDQGDLKDSHHKRLNDASVRSAIDQILQGIKGLVGELDGSAVLAREITGLKTTETDAVHMGRVNLEKRQQGASSRRGRLGWALRGKARFLALVESFDILVQKLYDLVPPGGSKAPSLIHIGGKEIDITPLKDTDPADTLPGFSGQDILIELEKHLESKDTIAFPLIRIMLNDVDESRKDLDAWLESRSTHSAYDNFIQRRLDGTCDWILDHPAFCQWKTSISDKKAKVLWVHGHAGYGKTVLTARMIEHLSASSTSPLAYFFFSAEIVDAADPFVVMRSWISQLVTQNRQAFELARRKWETTEGRHASRTDIKDLFKTIAQNTYDCTFIVDGLDECAGVGYDWQRDRKEALLKFFDALKESISGATLRVMVVSRNEREIQQGLDLLNSDGNCDVVEFQIQPGDVKPDATQYSRSILDYKLTNKSEEDRKKLSSMMVDRCESMFLGIRMLEDDLNGGKNIKQLQRIIDAAPYRLEHIYDRSWERINNLREDRRQRAYAILRWVTFSLRPMTTAEITEALLLADEACNEFSFDDLPDKIDDLYIKEELLDLCASLIETRQTGSNSAMNTWTIHHVHISVRQYLLCHMLSPPGHLITNENLRRSNESVQNNILAKTFIRYLDSAQVWDESKQHENNDHIFGTFRKYSTDLWHHYIDQETANSGELVLLLNKFFRPGNANWELWRKHGDGVLRSKMLEYDGEIKSGSPLFYASLLGLADTMKYLLDEVKMDINHVDESNRTAMLAACSKGWLSGVRQLLQKGASTSIASDQGRTPLYVAASNGHSEVLKLLLEEGADITTTNKHGWTPLNSASDGGHLEVVNLLIEKGADITSANDAGWTPLHSASDCGHLEIVKLFIGIGADITTTNKDGWTPLHSASNSGHVEIVQLLLEKRADITTTNKDGWTPLHLASNGGHLEINKLLVEAGADVLTSSTNGWTPINLASDSGHLEIVKLLLEKGADIETSNSYGWTPLHSASNRGHFETIKLLIEAGANITAPNDRGWTPLHLASESGHLETVKLLLENGAKITAAYDQGWTPLHLAAYNGSTDISKVLLERGASITALSEEKWTPLHLATYNGHIETAKMLLENGASITATNKNGWMPLNLAASNGHLKIFELFLEREADNTTAGNNRWATLDSASPGGLLEIAKTDLEKTTSITSLTANGWTPLKSATYNGHTELVKLLLENGADIRAEDHIGRPALFYAIKADQHEIFTVLLDHKDIKIDTKDFYGSTALSVAARFGRYEMLKTLTALPNIDLESVDKFGRTPLWWAQKQGHARAAEHLLKSTNNSSASIHTIPSPSEGPACFDNQGAWCDVCLATVGKIFYSCKICNGDDFAMCSDCHGIAAHCLVESHVLEVKRL